MGMFEFPTEEAADAYWEFFRTLDGTEPCFNDDPDRWTENYTSRPIPNKVAEDLCAGCHVIETCLAYALANPEETNIWGGTTETRRKEIRDA